MGDPHRAANDLNYEGGPYLTPQRLCQRHFGRHPGCNYFKEGELLAQAQDCVRTMARETEPAGWRNDNMSAIPRFLMSASTFVGSRVRSALIHDAGDTQRPPSAGRGPWPLDA